MDIKPRSLPRLPLSEGGVATTTGANDRDEGYPLSAPGSALILLVEGDLASRLIGANELLDEGYEIVESESASEAMSILDSRNDFDAVIADIDMDHAPGGLALVRYVASHHPSMKILIDSASIDAQAEANAIAASFLPKPYPAGALVRQMGRLLKSRTAPTHDLV